MRKIFIALLVGAAVAGSVLPAIAAGRHIHGSFTANAFPFPNYSSNTGTEKPGCLAGVEDVNWVRQSFKAPVTGKLTVEIEGFTGDWDLYLMDSKGTVLTRSDGEQVGPTMAPAAEKVVWKLRRGQKVDIAPCNWAGEPEVEVHYMFVGR
jgi:hypothetical protein